jgi:hypothetical protein
MESGYGDLPPLVVHRDNHGGVLYQQGSHDANLATACGGVAASHPALCDPGSNIVIRSTTIDAA